jgi:galactofuranosylgalactofuranosylrhamnosyl-N-acetylglucosaminyl-diphospho-decaprenol beta-1,5/1,6-galactofuranosyltransferase
VARTDYNAWWYFAVPLSVVRAQGLPLPLFIRCDDVEYGLRLARKGIRTVTLPGVGVWHEPFYLKDSAMLNFYERRNKFILLSMHYDIPSKRFADNFLVSAMRHLLAYRYDAAALDYAGAVEWLRGPKAIIEHPRANQAWISMAGPLLKQRSIPLANTVSAVADFESLEQLKAFIRPLRGWAFWRTAIQVVVRGLIGHRARPADVAVPALPRVLRRWHIWWTQQPYSEVAFRRDPFVVQATGEDSCIALTHSAPAFRWLLPRMLITYARLRWQARTCAAQWRSAAAQFHTEAFWKGYLGMAEPSTSPHVVQAKQQARAVSAQDSMVHGIPAGVDLKYAGQFAEQQ